jgi:peptidoglycan hydrolase CwlO-like protein
MCAAQEMRRPWVMFAGLNQQIQHKNAELSQCRSALADADRQIEELRNERYREHAERDHKIGNLAPRVQTTEAESANQESQIRTLEEELRLRQPRFGVGPL